MVVDMEVANLTVNVANGLHEAALSRIWVSGPGDLCSTCAMADECNDRSRCLHLVAGSGLTTRLDGPFRRFPFGAREVGQVARSLEPLVVNLDLGTSGLAEPGWLALHHIVAFGAFPIHRAERCLGVLAVFTRRAESCATTRTGMTTPM